MKKIDLTQEDLKQKILDDVAENVKQQVNPALRKSAETFSRIYYANVALEDLMDASLEFLVTSVLSIWELCLNRAPGEVKLRIYNTKKEVKGHIFSQMIVEIVNDNMPFIVDSVTGVINSLGYATHLMIHPVIKIERDASNTLKKVFPSGHEENEGIYESLIHCEILGIFSTKKLKALEEAIIFALNDTRSAVDDWEKMRTQLRLVIRDLQKNPPAIPKDELKETLAFLEWIEDNHFTFLGYCKYLLVPNQKTIQRSVLPRAGLGILRDPSKRAISHIFKGVELSPVNREQVLEPHPLLITKTSELSLVHRRDPMDSITIKKFNKNGIVVELHQFVGLFTSVAYNKSVWDIPLLRQKSAHIMKRSGFSEKWHDGKALAHILESFPREELFQASEDWLFDTCMAVLQLQNRQRLTLFIREDRFERFFSCLVYVPRELYDSALKNKIIEILERTLDGTVTNWQTQFGEMAFARIHFILTLHQKKIPTYNLKAIEEELLEASLTWRDHLYRALFNKFGEEKGQQLFEQYGKGFSRGYQERFTPDEAINAIIAVEKVFEYSEFQVTLSYSDGKDKSHLRLKIYIEDGPISLSNVLPVLENMDFRVLSEISFIITLSNNKKIWVHDFELTTQEGNPVELDHFRDYFLEGFNLIWNEKIDNDGFNRLIVRANFKWQECQVIRTYAKYMRQLNVTFSQAYMEEALSKYPHICHLMMQLFTCKFDPNSKEDRESVEEEIVKKIKTLLENVMILDEDRIINKFVNAVQSTLRTNYYQLKDGKQKPYLSIKIDCKAIEEMPLPRPQYEIFVYSHRVEGIHLRGGKVARGGIRWSDRREDFRTEVLGLMKAQTIKNVVIIPVGSKGGFIVKHPPAKDDPIDSLKSEVIFCYETMMRGLLDLTDNIKDSMVVPPPQVVCWDDDDTYLVVAADKGTATFSDLANQIAREYDYWLDDAFASGGSTGYDHKKMAITSRGAWESVKRHFKDMGIDANRKELTVVGVGDMAGDVFGNGMLRSKHLKLLGAFNHIHIFIDPSPDPAVSYQERKRLFDLPSSTWMDYNPALISPGGGVFDRKVKSIKITPEMKVLFGILEENLTPADLIQYILKAPADLLWFGGIGTFVKASTETNADVGDRVNDSLRINGSDVRVSVIAEGANLAITQQGRIEYAKNGGRLNTDAIDNSAGVDCSDHEVNIKILLGEVIKKKELTLSKRNKLLKDMTKDVAELVLKDNFWQNQAISLSQAQGYNILDEHARFIRDLESAELLNRALEGLPDEKEIERRVAEKQGLTRPELAVLLAYAKISLQQQLIQSDFPDLGILQSRLLSYFPERLRQPYENEILMHPLKREITATLFTNSIVNRMGISFVHEMKRQLGVTGAEIAKAYFIVRDLLDLISLWRDIEKMEKLSASFQTRLMLIIYENVKRLTDWFVRYDESHRNAEEITRFFKPDFLILKENLPAFFPANQYHLYMEKKSEFQSLGLPAALAERFINLKSLVSAPDMIILSKELGINIKIVAKVYFALGEQFGFEWLRKTAFSLSGETHWSQGAANALIEDFYTHQMTLTKKVLIKSEFLNLIFTESGALNEDILNSAEVEALLADLKNTSTIDFAMMTVMNRRLHLLTQGG